MANIEITAIDLGGIAIQECETEDGVIAFGAADVLAAGTILARKLSDGTFQIFAKGGNTDGNGVPVAVLNCEVVATAIGALAIRPIIAGKVRLEKLIIDADGDGSNIDAVVVDQLRDMGILALPVDELCKLDNGAP